jgi:hypothetical protein
MKSPLLKILGVLAIAYLILSNQAGVSSGGIIPQPFYYVHLVSTASIIASLVHFILFISNYLDKDCDWMESPLKRIVMQLLGGIMTSTVFLYILLVIQAYLIFDGILLIGKWVEISFSSYLIFIIFVNFIYFIRYLHNRSIETKRFLEKEFPYASSLTKSLMFMKRKSPDLFKP